MFTSQIEEQVRIELATEVGDHSRAKIAVKNNDEVEDAYISNSVEMNVSADNEDNQVWVSISAHNYAHVGHQTFSNRVDLISHHFTMAEAKALLEILSNELAKVAD